MSNFDYGDSTSFILVKKNEEKLDLEDYIRAPYINCVSGPDGPCLPPPELEQFGFGDAIGLKDDSSHFFTLEGKADSVYIITQIVAQPADEKTFSDIFSTFKIIK